MPLFALPAPFLTISYLLPVLYYISTINLINLLYILSNSYKPKLYHYTTLNS